MQSDIPMANEDLSVQEILDNHEDRLSAVEKRQDRQDTKLDTITQQLAAVRAEGNARALASTHGMDQVRQSIADLTMKISEQTGAQKRQNEIEEAKTRWWQRVGVIIGIVAALIAMLLSWQEVASYLWVDVLHWKEPWAQ